MIVPERKRDNDGNKVNDKGYLINDNGDIINNCDQQIMFDKDNLNDKGDLPAPFNVDKFNFNPQ